MVNEEYDKRLYIAKLPLKREFDWVNDIITTIGQEEIQYLLDILNKHIEQQNGDWDSYTEDCLETLEYMLDFFKPEAKR